MKAILKSFVLVISWECIRKILITFLIFCIPLFHKVLNVNYETFASIFGIVIADCALFLRKKHLKQINVAGIQKKGLYMSVIMGVICALICIIYTFFFRRISFINGVEVSGNSIMNSKLWIPFSTLWAPVVEEFVFRKKICSFFQNKTHQMVFSSLLFCLFHVGIIPVLIGIVKVQYDNMTLLHACLSYIYTLPLGFIFYFICQKFGLKYSILCHMICNIFCSIF